MPHHDHGSPPFNIKKLKDGVYILHDVYFIMPGTWMLSINVDNEDVIDFLQIKA
jgi:hypothetical protein